MHELLGDYCHPTGLTRWKQSVCPNVFTFGTANRHSTDNKVWRKNPLRNDPNGTTAQSDSPRLTLFSSPLCSSLSVAILTMSKREYFVETHRNYKVYVSIWTILFGLLFHSVVIFAVQVNYWQLPVLILKPKLLWYVDLFLFCFYIITSLYCILGLYGVANCFTSRRFICY